MSKFYVGQAVTVGQVGNTPQHSSVPYPGRVIAIDANNRDGYEVIVLVKKESEYNDFEQIDSYRSDGLCMSAVWAEGQPLAWPYTELNIYPVEEEVTIQPV